MTFSALSKFDRLALFRTSLSHARSLLPKRGDYTGFRSSWRQDVVAGLTVGVVALPLALGFGMAAGLTATEGLITAVVAGFVAAVFGGSDYQVSGPTGAMAVILLPVVAQHGPSALVLVTLMAGILVLFAGILGLGRLVAYIPWPVVEGFTFGIGVIIFLQQVPMAVGIEAPKGSNTALVAVKAATTVDWAAALPTVGVLAVTLAIVLGVQRFLPKLPAALIAVTVATLTVIFVGIDTPTIGQIPSSLPMPAIDLPGLSTVKSLFGPAIAVAALCAIESLLSARVVDSIARTDPSSKKHARPSDPDRELVGQGLANIASGLFGGMPATGAIARTAVNQRAGARTRMAAIIHSVLLLSVIYFGSAVISRIPLTALAGVLMATAVKMIDRRASLTIMRSTRSDAVVFVLTAVITISLDLITAVEIGIAVAAFLALRHLARVSRVRRLLPSPDERIAVFQLRGSLFFGAIPGIFRELENVEEVGVVILRLSDMTHVDASGAQGLSELVGQLESRGIAVLLKGILPVHDKVFRTVGIDLPCYSTIEEAVAAGRRILDSDE